MKQGETVDRDVIDEFVLVSEEQAFLMCRKIARAEGLLVGISSGAAAHAAFELAGSPSNHGETLVCVFTDTGQRYPSVDGLFPS